jgi:hypothetical protein
MTVTYEVPAFVAFYRAAADSSGTDIFEVDIASPGHKLRVRSAQQ